MEKERAEVEREVSLKQTELKRLLDFAQNIEAIKQELRDLNLQLEAALEHMPRTFNLSGLLRKFTMLAQNSGVELATFKPKRGEGKNESAFYSTIGIDCELQGTFSQLLVFLDQLSRLKRIVNVESLRIRVSQGGPQRSGSIMTSTQASIKTYRFAE